MKKAFRIRVEGDGVIIRLENMDIRITPERKEHWIEGENIGLWCEKTVAGIFVACELLEGDRRISDYIDDDIQIAEEKIRWIYICPELGVEEPVSFADILRAVKIYLERGNRYLIR